MVGAGGSCRGPLRARELSFPTLVHCKMRAGSWHFRQDPVASAGGMRIPPMALSDRIGLKEKLCIHKGSIGQCRCACKECATHLRHPEAVAFLPFVGGSHAPDRHACGAPGGSMHRPAASHPREPSHRPGRVCAKNSCSKARGNIFGAPGAGARLCCIQVGCRQQSCCVWGVAICSPGPRAANGSGTPQPLNPIFDQ